MSDIEEYKKLSEKLKNECDAGLTVWFKKYGYEICHGSFERVVPGEVKEIFERAKHGGLTFTEKFIELEMRIEMLEKKEQSND